MTSTDEVPPPSRDELVAMVAKAHKDASYGDASAAGRALAAQSKLPRVIAENLGAGFGQWDFFPEAAEIVDFAVAYVPPETPEDLWTLARTWAADDAAGKHTLMALVGRDILQHELKRIEEPRLKELAAETRVGRLLTLRTSLGLPVPANAAAKVAAPPSAPASAPTSAPRSSAGAEPRPKRVALSTANGPLKMPKPEFVKPVKAPPPPPPKRYQHPKFGEGVLESQAGTGPEAKLTIKFASGSKTLLAQYVTEIPTEPSSSPSP